MQQKWPDRFYGTKSHARRRAGSKDTEDQFFPEALIGSVAPHFPKLIKARANLSLSRLMCGTYVFNNYRLARESHLIVNTQILGLRFSRCQRK